MASATCVMSERMASIEVWNPSILRSSESIR